MDKIYVIGIGYRPLDRRAREIIYKSEVILANNRLLEVFKDYRDYKDVKDRIKVINNVNETMEFIRNNYKKHLLSLLASGDPMFFGIGRMMVNEFGKDSVEILPDLSSVQIGFSRIKEPWSDAFFISLHGGPDPAKRRKLEYEINDIPSLLQRHNKIAILTDKQNSPAEIAKTIDSSLTMYVCERLGYSDEKITEGTPQEIAEMFFSDPNVVIIQNKEPACRQAGHRTKNTDKSPSTHPSPSRGEAKGGGENLGSWLLALGSDIRFGLKEDEIQHSRGLITKDEVRAVTIHKLRLSQKGVLWDIGAGSGSISVEAARLYPGLKVFAVESEGEQIENINLNKKRFNITNIEIIKGKAPDVLEGLPTPDRVFIGGSGGRLSDIVSSVERRIGSGIIGINATTVETLNEAVQCLDDAKFKVEVCEVSISRSKMINQKRHMSALNPIFIVIGEKG